MNSLTIFVVLALAVGSLSSVVEDILGSHDKKTMMQCGKELGVDLKQRNLENVPEFKCLFKCMLVKDGILRDGVFSEEQIMKAIKEDTELDAAGKDKAGKVVPKCLEEVKNTSDVCAKSYEITECISKGLI